MFDFIFVSVPLILNAEVEKVWKLSKLFLFSEICWATLLLVIIRLSGRISPTIRPDSRIPEKQAG